MRETLQGILWMAAPLGIIKVNWDAALNFKKGQIGFRIIARDSARCVMATRNLTQKTSVDTCTTEAWATLHAVMFSKDVHGVV